MTTLISSGEFQCRNQLRRVVTVWLRLYQLRSGAYVAIVTDLDRGPSVTNAAEELATAVRLRWCRQGEALAWWEHYRRANRDDFDRVLFRWNGQRYVDPEWKPGSRAMLEELLGMWLELE